MAPLVRIIESSGGRGPGPEHGSDNRVATTQDEKHSERKRSRLKRRIEVIRASYCKIHDTGSKEDKRAVVRCEQGRRECVHDTYCVRVPASVLPRETLGSPGRGGAREKERDGGGGGGWGGRATRGVVGRRGGAKRVEARRGKPCRGEAKRGEASRSAYTPTTRSTPQRSSGGYYMYSICAHDI